MEKLTEPKAPLRAQPRYGWTRAPLLEPGNTRVAGGGAASPQSAVPTVPMKDAVLYQKEIDNSAITYRHDPRDRHMLHTNVSLGLFIVLILVVASAPRLWERHSGYRQAALTEQVERLKVVRESLKVERGRLADLRRVATLAEAMGFSQTEDSSYAWTSARPLRGGGEHRVAQLVPAPE